MPAAASLPTRPLGGPASAAPPAAVAPEFEVAPPAPDIVPPAPGVVPPAPGNVPPELVADPPAPDIVPPEPGDAPAPPVEAPPPPPAETASDEPAKPPVPPVFVPLCEPHATTNRAVSTSATRLTTRMDSSMSRRVAPRTESYERSRGSACGFFARRYSDAFITTNHLHSSSMTRASAHVVGSWVCVARERSCE